MWAWACVKPQYFGLVKVKSNVDYGEFWIMENISNKFTQKWNIVAWLLIMSGFNLFLMTNLIIKIDQVLINNWVFITLLSFVGNEFFHDEHCMQLTVSNTYSYDLCSYSWGCYICTHNLVILIHIMWFLVLL